MKNKIFKALIISFLLINFGLYAQKQSRLDLALRSIESQRTNWALTENDISDLAISDTYETEHNGLTHFYFVQRYKGIEIHNAITSVHVTRDGKVFDSPSRFYSNISDKINTSKARIDAIDALIQVVNHFQISNALIPKNVSRTDDGKLEIAKTNFTHSDIPVKLKYTEDKNGNLRLSWDLTIELTTSHDYWTIRVDAVTGEILDQHNLTIKCSFDHPGHTRCVENEKVFSSKNIAVKDELINQNKNTFISPAIPNSYNVIQVPNESPKHSPRQIVVNPALPSASPFAWHDTNGVNGAEYTITRGNNVHAYPDRNGDNISDGNEPNGGSQLMFDFPFDQNLEPSGYLPAATVNLFYMNNMMHDVMHQFGFNEVAGNFQFNNYNKGGQANDYVRAESQDGSGTDNANFSTPADGIGPRMQMFLWLASGVETYIYKPDSLVGSIDSRRASGWGGAPPPNIIGDVVIGDDHSNTPTLGCANGFRRNEIEGKIVLIERGTCEFGLKALNAERGGAAAVIICNFEDAFVSMAAGLVGSQVTIPAYFTTRTICNRMKVLIAQGGFQIEIKEPGTNAGPDTLDGDFDNGVIAHEYGHGISNRLTGGPANANCLSNQEQMGEGWSDFFALVMQAKAGDVGTTPKGIGTYVQNEKPDGYGIRRRPYTTDFSRNEFTYKNIDIEVHNLGEVWAAALWDLYWAMAERYGFDPDFSNKASGNNQAIQLVMDGMKMQPCTPGFLDGRDAILEADSVKKQGKNSCLIWEVFARRGMGFFAKQGSTNMVLDETEDYYPALVCINKILVNKKAGVYNGNTFVRNDVVKPGDQFAFTIDISNYKASPADNVIITDNLPDGTTYVDGSGNPTPQVIGNQLIWTYPQLLALESKRISYKVKSNPSISSTTLWYDNIDAENDNWDIDLFKGIDLWYRQEPYGRNDTYGWIAEERTGVSNDFVLWTKHPFQLSGNDPSVLFYHYFNTEKGFDGGMLEVSKDGFFWEVVKPEEFSLNGYTGIINYQTFVLPNTYAFSGNSETFIPSVFSLAKYKNDKVQIRFRFGNDSLNVAPTTGPLFGWVVDDVEFIYPEFYNGEVCVTSNAGDHECAKAPGKGVLADTDKIVGTDDKPTKSELKIYPNPAADHFVIQLDQHIKYNHLKIIAANGQELKNINLQNTENILRVSTKDLPKGMIILEFSGAHTRSYAKLIIK